MSSSSRSLSSGFCLTNSSYWALAWNKSDFTKRALGEVVAGHVFQQVLTEAQSAPSTRSSKVMLVLAGQSREGIEHDIATSVAAIARDTSWSDLRPFLVSAAIKTAALMIIYSVSVFLLMA